MHARPGRRRQGHLPRLRPGDRGLPLRRRRHLLHRQSGRGDHEPGLHPRLLHDLPGAGAGADVQGRAARRPPSASRTTGRASPRTSTRSSTATSTAIYAPFTNVGADPNITAAYDYYDFFTNGSDLDADHQQRPAVERPPAPVQGLGRLRHAPGSSRSALSAYYRTGTPRHPLRLLGHYGRYEFFLTERGAEGRTPDNYEADLHLGYPTAPRAGRPSTSCRRLQRPQRPAADPARPALGLPGVPTRTTSAVGSLQRGRG